ncbi:MAG: GTP cyclohydrolase MptA [Thermoplasmata archaeon]|nr:GTP cyclohydrolase MptA [Thermoplasmata archaeon]
MLGNEKLPDIQAEKPQSNYKLTRVGVTNVVKQIVVKRPNKTVFLTPTINLFVDLPATKKGSDMSRNIEIIEEIVEKSTMAPCSGIEELAENIVKLLIKKHTYASYAEIEMHADYFLERENPSGKRSQERYVLFSRAIMDHGTIRKMLGVKVTGITVCPCAMETVRSVLKDKYPDYAKFLNEIPVVSHNQRNNTTIMVEVPEGYSIEANDLIEIAENAMSSPTYEILKRKDEEEVVYRAHTNPKFVEDVVRDVLKQISKKYSNFPKDTLITVRSESEESIHKHNAFAERISTLGEILNNE